MLLLHIPLLILVASVQRSIIVPTTTTSESDVGITITSSFGRTHSHGHRCYGSNYVPDIKPFEDYGTPGRRIMKLTNPMDVLLPDRRGQQDYRAASAFCRRSIYHWPDHYISNNLAYHEDTTGISGSGRINLRFLSQTEIGVETVTTTKDVLSTSSTVVGADCDLIWHPCRKRQEELLPGGSTEDAGQQCTRHVKACFL